MTDAWLAWDDGDGRLKTVAALLIDFSETGALVLTDELSPIGRPAWLGLNRPVLPNGVEVRRVGATTTRSGPHLLRVAFALVCPREIILAAISPYTFD